MRLHAVDVPVVDDLTLFGEAEIPSTVSFDVTYTPVGKVRNLRPTSSDPRDPNSFKGELRFDPSQPDGTPRKQIDSARLRALGWRHRVDLLDGIRATYDWFVKNGGA